MVLFGRIYNFISYWYFQYLLCTALYMLEPWERKLFNSVVVAVAAMSIYTTYIFLPDHAMAIWRYLMYKFDGNVKEDPFVQS